MKDKSTSITKNLILRTFRGHLDLSDQEIQQMNQQYDHFYRDTLGSPRYMMAPMVLRSDLAFRMMVRKYKCSLWGLFTATITKLELDKS